MMDKIVEALEAASPHTTKQDQDAIILGEFLIFAIVMTDVIGWPRLRIKSLYFRSSFVQYNLDIFICMAEILESRNQGREGRSSQ